MEIEKHWQEILGEPMSAEVSTRILKIQKALGIKDDDALWQIIIPLEYYQRIFEQFPEKARVEAGEVARSLREASAKVTEASAAVVKEIREKAALEIQKMQEEAKKNITYALGTTLETEIRNAVSRLQSQSNRPLHKKWLAVMAVLLPIAAGLGGWGLWSFYAYSKNVGAVNTAAYANPVSKSFFHLMECDEPGWKTKWSADGKELWCYPHTDKAGNQYGWRIR